MSHVCLLNALGLQVATRLPQCGGVMFSFKTYIRPLKALEQRTAVMQRLLAAFLALPDEVVSPLHVLCS